MQVSVLEGKEAHRQVEESRNHYSEELQTTNPLTVFSAQHQEHQAQQEVEVE